MPRFGEGQDSSQYVSAVHKTHLAGYKFYVNHVMLTMFNVDQYYVDNTQR